MDRTSTRPSLRTRIIEAESGPAYAVDRSYFTPRRQESFVERYRGTEYEMPTMALVEREPLMSRGRSFVLVVGATVMGMTAVLLAATPG